MNANHAALALTLASLIALAPTGLAQSIGGQAEEATEHARGLAEDAARDPEGFAENATDPSWQAEQANFTHTWSCDTTTAANDDAGDTLQDQDVCPQRDDAEAGNQQDEEQGEDEQQPRADAEEAEQAETALWDILAAFDAYQESLQEDPQQAPDHTLTFVNRTLTVIERLIDPPRILASQAADAATTCKDLAHRVTHEALDGIQHGLAQAGHAALSVPLALTDGAASLAQTGQQALHAAASAIPDVKEPLQDGASSTMDMLQSAVDTLKSSLSHDGDAKSDTPADTAKAPVQDTEDLLEPLDRIEQP